MDIEDRDHFKTIASASVVPLSDWQPKSGKETSNSRLDPASCLDRAKMICGCYRRDEAQDPETFAAALAIVLGDYPASIVEYAADPRTGIVSEFKMGLPNVGQIKGFLDAVRECQAKLAHYDALPKAQRFVPAPLKSEPNLFVPMEARAYEAMADLHKKTQGERSHYASHTCSDGVVRQGIWVPLKWFEEGKAA